MLIHYLKDIACFSVGIIKLTVFLSLMINGTLDLKLFPTKKILIPLKVDIQ